MTVRYTLTDGTVVDRATMAATVKAVDTARRHAEHGMDTDIFPGLMRRRDGTIWLRPDPVSRGNAAIPLRTRQNIAACAVLGLAYWDEHPAVNTLWAVTDDRTVVEVRIDRRAQTSGRVDLRDRWKWTVAGDLDEAAGQLGLWATAPPA